ncbi:ulp1 protease family, C-terminal catalytic domain-containing protein [Tanacetum coccineum]
MNNNEMKNDSVQEKQDVDKDENAEKEKVKTEKEKQDKADKVDNVQEKQDNDKEEIVIIDNSKTPMSYEAKYKEVCDVLKNMFSMHLKEVQHQRAKDVLNKKPTILRPKWGTKDNNTDCGVFLMMHMENYNGETARNWNLEFPTKEKGNTYDIIKMRMRFAAKILTHEINIHHENISKEAL